MGTGVSLPSSYELVTISKGRSVGRKSTSKNTQDGHNHVCKHVRKTVWSLNASNFYQYTHSSNFHYSRLLFPSWTQPSVHIRILNGECPSSQKRPIRRTQPNFGLSRLFIWEYSRWWKMVYIWSDNQGAPQCEKQTVHRRRLLIHCLSSTCILYTLHTETSVCRSSWQSALLSPP